MRWGKGRRYKRNEPLPTPWQCHAAVIPHRCQSCGKWFWMETGRKKVQVAIYEHNGGVVAYAASSYRKVTWRCSTCGPAA